MGHGPQGRGSDWGTAWIHLESVRVHSLIYCGAPPAPYLVQVFAEPYPPPLQHYPALPILILARHHYESPPGDNESIQQGGAV